MNKYSRADVLIVPGYHGSGAAHWQTWLQAQIPNTKRVAGIDWEIPRLQFWAEAITRELQANKQKTIIVAHSFGCLATVRALASYSGQITGVILVAPADPRRFTTSGLARQPCSDKDNILDQLLNCSLNAPGILVASRDDPWMKFEHAYAWAKRWQLDFLDAGNAGHINVDSGFGPWPFIQHVIESLCGSLDGGFRQQAV